MFICCCLGILFYAPSYFVFLIKLVLVLVQRNAFSNKFSCACLVPACVFAELLMPVTVSLQAKSRKSTSKKRKAQFTSNSCKLQHEYICVAANKCLKAKTYICSTWLDDCLCVLLNVLELSSWLKEYMSWPKNYANVAADADAVAAALGCTSMAHIARYAGLQQLLSFHVLLLLENDCISPLHCYILHY